MRRRSVPTLLLIAALLLTMLVGCGSRSELNIEQPTAAEPREMIVSDTAAEVAAAPAEPASLQGVSEAETAEAQEPAHYEPTWHDLPTGAEFVEASCVSGETLYYSASVLSGEQTYTDEVTGEAYAYDTYESRLYAMDLPSGESTPWQADVSAMSDDGWQDETTVCALRASDDGGVWLAETRTRWKYDDGAYLNGGWQLRLQRFDADGTRLREVLLSPPEEEAAENAVPYTVYLDADGRFYASDWENVYVWDENGEFLFSLVNEFYGQLVPYSADLIGVSSYGANGQYGFVPVDTENKAWGEVRALPENAYNISPGSGKYDFYYEDGGCIYGYLAEEETAERVLDWMDYDVDSSELDTYALVPDGTVYAVSHTWQADEAKTQFVILRRTEAGALVQKKLLRLGAIDLSFDLRGNIIDFNKTNADYRIEVTDFAQMDDPLGQLEQALSAGEIDLVAADGLPIERYASQGLLADLQVFLDEDETLSEEDFLPSVLRASYVNEKLVRMPTGFRLSAIAAKKSVMQDAPLTYEAVYEAMAKLHAGATVFHGSANAEDLFERLASRMLGTPSGVTEQELADLLNIASLAEKTAAKTDDASEFLRMRQNKQLLTEVHLQSLEDFYAVCAALEQDICFPSGASLAFEDSLAIAAASEEQDAAWSFIRMKLSPDAQRTLWVFPMRADVLQERAQAAMTQMYRLDENGEPILDADGEPIALARGSVGFGADEAIEIFALSEEQYAHFTQLLHSAAHCELTGAERSAAVRQAAQPFFEQDMTAEETAAEILRKMTP